MIPANDVTDAILAALRGTGGDALPVGDHTAPNPAPALYGVLETPPGSIDAGSLGEPGDAITVMVRVRAVAKNTTITAARQGATHLLDELVDRLRTTAITGTGWAVTGRTHLGRGPVIVEGPVANATDDWALLVSE